MSFELYFNLKIFNKAYKLWIQWSDPGTSQIEQWIISPIYTFIVESSSSLNIKDVGPNS